MPAASPRYLLVASNFPPIVGGSATVYRNLCAAAGGALAVLTARRDYRTLEALETAETDRADYPIARIDLVRPALAGSAQHPTRLLARLAADCALVVRVVAALRALMRRHRFRAVVVGELVYGGWIGLAAKYLFRCPYVVYVHGEELTTGGAGISDRLKSFYLRKADGVVAVSNFTRNLLTDQYALPAARIARIPNAVDTERFRPLAPRDELSRRYGLDGKRVFLTVGRLVARKGLDMALRALPRVLEGEPRAHYLIVGDGPIREELGALADLLGIAEHVTFCGHVDDDELIDHYALARCFVMPNRRMPDGDTEGFGLVFLEANACGLPVVAGRAGGTGDAVTDGENGLLVDGNDVAAIAEATLRLLCDDDLWRRMRENGLRVARAADWQACWQALSRFLDGIGR